MGDVHVSIDIEACGEVVLSIGACVFDTTTGATSSEFYCVPSVEDQMRAGLKMDAGAFAWLLKQSDACRGALANQAPAIEAFGAFSAWWPDRAAWCWAYPSSFDLPVIARAMNALGMRPPWKWTRTMDGRTLWQLAIAADPSMAKVEGDGPLAHTALADAKQQASWFARYMLAVAKGVQR